MKRIALEETTSTNRYAKELPEDESHELTLVTAEFQTAGRGAGTNTWESERSQNLLFSIISYPKGLLANQMFALSEVTALAIRDALCSIVKVQGSTIPSSFGGVGGGFNAQCSMLNSQFFIKWPNDIYWNNRKAVGMLIENDLHGKQVHRSVIGVGVNINQTAFISDAPNPVSLAQILGRKVDRDQVLNSIMQRFIYYYGIMEEECYSELHQLYMQHLYRKDALHPYSDEGGIFRARIRDVKPTGHLILEDENGELRRYDFKEVRFI
ncbi:MAG: biotin--[acetyl-CoA-carboxylase] ligase [Bacteroidaceae bacterium]|nr:biotin--[acetyl-CoA-carboxylase] ligase [Bacteroidaceae bacterium]